MMKCTHVNNLLDDYVDGYVQLPEQQAIAQHLSNCAHCRAQLEQLHQFRHVLKNIPIAEPGAHFENRILTSIAAEKSLQQMRRPKRMSIPAFSTWLAAGIGSAVTAFLLLWITTFTPSGSSPALDTLTVQLTTHEVQRVNLAFNSRHEISNATFQIELPANINIQGHPGKRSLQWQATLKQGTNRLTLPLIATNPVSENNNDHFVVARILHDGKSREFKIKIKTQPRQDNRQHISSGVIIHA